MPFSHYLKALVLTATSLVLTGCLTQMKYGPQYSHPAQPVIHAAFSQPLVTISGSKTQYGRYIKLNALLTPNGQEYLQIQQSHVHGTPSNVLLANTPKNRQALADLFNRAHHLLSQASDHGLQFKHHSLGCIGPKKNEPNCAKNGFAFYPGQMHLAIEASTTPKALFRAVEKQHGPNALDQLLLTDIDELAKMKPAIDASPAAFEALRNKHQKQLTKQTF